MDTTVTDSDTAHKAGTVHRIESSDALRSPMVPLSPRIAVDVVRGWWSAEWRMRGIRHIFGHGFSAFAMSFRTCRHAVLHTTDEARCARVSAPWAKGEGRSKRPFYPFGQCWTSLLFFSLSLLYSV